MNDEEQEVIALWDEGHCVEKIAEMYGKDEEEIENIIDEAENYADD